MVVREFDDFTLVTKLNDSLKRYRPTLLRSLPKEENPLIQTGNLGNAVEIVFPLSVRVGCGICALMAAFLRMSRKVDRDSEKAVYALDAIVSVANNLLVIIGLFSQQGIEISQTVAERLASMIDRCKKVRNSEEIVDLVSECELDVSAFDEILQFLRDEPLTALSAVAVDMVYRKDGSFCHPLGFLSFLPDAFDVMVSRVMNL